MATGSKWKRPWEENLYEASGVSPPAIEPTRHASVSIPQPTAPPSQYAALAWPRMQTPTYGTGGNPQPGTSSTYAASFSNRDVGYLRENSGYTGPLPYKRQRVDGRDAHSAIGTSLFTSPSVAAHHHGLQDSYEARNRHPEKFFSRGSLISEKDGRSMEPKNIGESSSPQYKRDIVNEEPINTCQTCAELKSLVPQVVNVADGLYEDMVMALQRALPDQHEDILAKKCRRPRPNLGRLCQSVEWVLRKLNASFEMGKDLATLRVPLLRSDRIIGLNDDKVPERELCVEAPRARWERDDGLNDQSRKQSSSQGHDDLRRIDVFRPSPHPAVERGKSIASDASRQQMTSSPPVLAPWAGHSAQPDSPMQAPPSTRHLPSPLSLNLSASSQYLPPVSPSYPGPKSPHTAHLQELRHQLSTKSLAHQILQGEHDKLLAAYSRLQTRCATLDKKSQVSDMEINNLAEDRARLEGQVAALESQVEELQLDRDEAHKQSAASNAQYMKIIALSSKLHAPDTADRNKWKADREAWAKEKEALLSNGLLPSRIVGGSAEDEPQLRSVDSVSVGLSSEPSTQGTVGCREIQSSNESDNVLTSTSVERLREEIIRLRKNCLATEASLEAWRIDSTHLNDALLSLGALNDRMRQRCEDLGGQRAHTDAK